MSQDSPISPLGRFSACLSLVSLALFVLGCPKAEPGYHSVTLESGSVKSSPAAAPQGAPLATFAGRIQLQRAQVEPAEAAPGETITLKLTWVAQQDIFDEWRVFVHGALRGAELPQLQDDHEPLDGKYPTARWRRGDIIEEAREIAIAPGMAGRSMDFWVGLYAGDQRMQVDQADRHDGTNRVKAATLLLKGGVDELRATASLAPGPFKIDGQLDEPGWQQAQRLGPFVHYHGRGTPPNSTYARLSYDAEALYVGFECQDPDIWTTYTKRDDPIYNQEAVEIFIDVDRDLHTYVELQQSPANVHFDAAFEGRRKNMDTGYNAEYETALALDGTLNQPDDVDRGFSAEWRIPFNQIKGLSTPPKPGDSWRINLFRLDKVRRGGRVVDNHASAWSSPLSGDFHNIQRFGWLEFGAGPPAAGIQPGAGAAQ